MFISFLPLRPATLLVVIATWVLLLCERAQAIVMQTSPGCHLTILENKGIGSTGGVAEDVMLCTGESEPSVGESVGGLLTGFG